VAGPEAVEAVAAVVVGAIAAAVAVVVVVVVVVGHRGPRRGGGNGRETWGRTRCRGNGWAREVADRVARAVL